MRDVEDDEWRNFTPLEVQDSISKERIWNLYMEDDDLVMDSLGSYPKWLSKWGALERRLKKLMFFQSF